MSTPTTSSRRGRPPVPAEKKLAGTSLRLDAELVSKVDQEADRENRTRSNMVRTLLIEALDRRAGVPRHQ